MPCESNRDAHKLGKSPVCLNPTKRFSCIVLEVTLGMQDVP